MNYNVIEKIHSTNSYIKENIDNLADWYVLRAIEQTNGRGRFQKTWLCEKGKDLAMSILIPCDEKIEQSLENLTQIIGATVADLLSCIAPSIASQIKIKLPNDILVNGRKICGILTEAITCGDITRIVIGIGLNVNSERATVATQLLANSLFDVTGKTFDLDALAKEIAESIFNYFRQD